MDAAKVWGVAAGVDVAGVDLARVLGFGSLDCGVVTGVHTLGGHYAA